jgi:hypothetical protein
VFGDNTERERIQGQDDKNMIREGAFRIAFGEGNKYG